MPFLKATISPAMTFDSPYTRAMPSPTSRTCPTSVRVISGVNCSISRWITELISSALNFMRLPFDQSLADLFETILYGSIADLVADLDDQAADQRGIGRDFHHGGRGDHPAHPLAEGGLLVGFERDRRSDVDRDTLVSPIPDLAGLAG